MTFKLLSSKTVRIIINCACLIYSATFHFIGSTSKRMPVITTENDKPSL